MDFFEAQTRAKKRTARLVALFALAVFGTVLGGYGAAIWGLRATHNDHPRRVGAREYQIYNEQPGPPPSLWQPQLFFGISALTLAVVGLASLWKWNEFSGGGSAVAESVGGRRVDPHTIDTLERRLLNVVEEMAIASGVPVPAVYILDDEPAVNAFAAGLTTSDAVVAVTRGTLEKLTRDEQQGVVGHEFSHILNGDMRLNLRLTALVFGLLVIGLAGRGILWSLRYQSLGGSRDRDDKGSIGIVAAIAIAGVALLILGYIGYFFGRLIQAAVSRQREFLADASAVQFTRNPRGLAGALKKIGGFALGSSMQSNKSAAIGHFFFAQGFRSNFGGLWATHPPLDQRIRAIEPQFDGKMFEPPEVVDVAHESFQTAGFARPQAGGAADASRISPPASRLHPPASSPADAIASIGTLTPAQLADAQLLLVATPAPLRAAAHSAADAPALLYGLLLAPDATLRAHQRSLVATRAGAEVLRTLDELEPALRQLRPEHRLPLVQLALPTLRQLAPTALTPLLDTLDELVHADGRVNAFEFALQRLLVRTLALGRNPAEAVVQFYSFNALTAEIAVVLSALARASDNQALDATAAFAAGASQLKLIESRLALLDESASDFPALDTALDKLAAASAPIKQRTLLACAHVVSADGRILIAEAELLRAIAAALDCPMPPLVA